MKNANGEYKNMIGKLRTDKGDPTAVRKPSPEAEAEANAEGEEPAVEQIEQDVANLLATAEQQGALKVLEPAASKAGMDAKKLMEQAQKLPETAGKKPEELASALAADSTLLDKIRSAGGGESMPEDDGEHETETMGGMAGAAGAFKNGIAALRAKP